MIKLKELFGSLNWFFNHEAHDIISDEGKAYLRKKERIKQASRKAGVVLVAAMRHDGVSEIKTKLEDKENYYELTIVKKLKP